MPCMGPSASYSKKLATDLVEKLWPELEKAYQNNYTIFLLISDVEKFLRELLDLIDHYGYDYQTHELNRYKYLTVGVLNTMFPEEEYTKEYPSGTATGSRLSHEAFERTSKETFTKHLADTFFLLDCEDF